MNIRINKFKLLQQTVEAHQATFDALAQNLNGVKRSIRQIDPQLLGEKRYEEKGHWEVTKKVYDAWYALNHLCLAEAIEDLNESKEVLEGHLTAIEGVRSKIRRIDPKFLGEARYDAKTSVPARKAMDAFYSLKRLVLSPKIRPLCATLENQFAAVQKEISGASAENINSKSSSSSFEKLKISEHEKKQLRTFIPMVANDSIAALIGKLSTLLAAKRELHSLHPLKSLEFILNDPDLRKNIVTISKNSQRWVGVWGVAKGFKPQTAEKLKVYQEKDNSVIPCIPEFAKSLGLNKTQQVTITTLAKEGKWEEFIQSLVEFAKT